MALPVTVRAKCWAYCLPFNFFLCIPGHDTTGVTVLELSICLSNLGKMLRPLSGTSVTGVPLTSRRRLVSLHSPQLDNRFQVRYTLLHAHAQAMPHPKWKLFFNGRQCCDATFELPGPSAKQHHGTMTNESCSAWLLHHRPLRYKIWPLRGGLPDCVEISGPTLEPSILTQSSGLKPLRPTLVTGLG